MLSVALVSVFVVAGCALLLGLITLFNNPTRYTNRVFAMLATLCGIYTVVNFLADHEQTHALLWVRLTFTLATFMLLLMMLFVNNFPQRGFRRQWELVLSAVAVIVAGVTLNGGFIPSVILKPDKTDVIAGPFYPVFLVYLVAALVLSIVLVRAALKHSKGADRERVKYLVLGLFIAAALLACTNLFLPLLVGNNDLAGFGTYFILIFISFTFYAIIRHRLFNVRLVVARSVAYILLLLTLAIAYSLMALQLGGLIFDDAKVTTAHQAYDVALALVLAFTFQPLRHFFERITNRVFYRDSYDSQQVINDFSKVLVSELHLDMMLRRSVTELCRNLHIQYGQIVVFNHDRVYHIEHYGPLPKRLMIAPELHRLNKRMLVADELEDDDRKALMDEHGIRVSVMLHTRDEFIGYLLLGDKLSGDIYSSQDLELLEIITKELAVGILNAKAYAEIQEFNVTLQARVDHATNRLRVANRHLKELDKAKDEFISMASHQLRTPLTTIKGYLSMMQEGDAGRLTATQKEFVSYAFGSSERMVNLISDLLNVSRLSAGRFLIQAKPTDVVAMVEDEVRQLQPHATNKGLQLTFEHSPKAFPLVELDDNKTRQVVMNFIDNAIYYTQTGSVMIRLSKVGEAARLEVTDTGIGVPEGAKRKLFSKFYRAENAQEVRPDGTGLGLYLARRVIEDQGGTIIFKSVEGKGSTFGFELPLKARNPVAKAKEPHGKH